MRAKRSVGLVLLAAVSARADENPTPADRPTPEQIEFFEKKIRPLLVKQCYECHSAGAKKVRAGLLLDTREGVRKGGASGPVVVPGDPEKSLLVKAVRHADESLKMPKEKLSAAVIADLEAWVKMGAPEIGRASCRERVEIWVVGVCVKRRR